MALTAEGGVLCPDPSSAAGFAGLGKNRDDFVFFSTELGHSSDDARGGGPGAGPLPIAALNGRIRRDA